MARPRQRTKHELRCFCSRKPLLATYGVDEKGRLYVHQKVFKAHRIFGETLFYGGEVKLLCRECLRWQTVVIQTSNTAALEPTETPEVLRDEVTLRSSLPNDPTHR